jgi:hypothetical protein
LTTPLKIGGNWAVLIKKLFVKLFVVIGTLA